MHKAKIIDFEVMIRPMRVWRHWQKKMGAMICTISAKRISSKIMLPKLFNVFLLLMADNMWRIKTFNFRIITRSCNTRCEGS